VPSHIVPLGAVSAELVRVWVVRVVSRGGPSHIVPLGAVLVRVWAVRVVFSDYEWRRKAGCVSLSLSLGVKTMIRGATAEGRKHGGWAGGSLTGFITY